MNDQHGTWLAIQRLRGMWEESYPAVAAGAVNAIAGFDYQFVIVLRDTVKRWLSEDHGRRGEPGVFTEILSDVLDFAAEGPVHVTQVKRTQSGSTVRAALQDLWLIYRLASASEPVLSEIMGYRIASAQSKIRDVHEILSTWKPNDVDESELALQDFRRRVSIEMDADPESELLTLLANECHADEPLADTHRWIGRLVHAASTPSGFVTAGKEIWNELYALSASADRNKTRSSIYFWQQHDHPPEGIQAGSYLTGERPLPRHLRLGFFAPRETVLGPLSAKIIAWLTPHPATNDDSLRLPVFWIGGRSGTGKSVALLQILSLIHAEQIGPVLWLGPHTAALSDAIRWAQRLRRPGETVVIGLDDPYAPVAQNDAIALWQQAISEMITTRQGDDPTELPVLICCGPTEQAERFERELSDDVCLTREDLPHENSEDRAILRRWFRARTGHESPEIGDGDVLLVQLFFEWKVGAPLQAFANRLRQRIAMAETSERKFQLIDQFSRILALNRLYVGYPRRALERTLTPDQKSVFLRLQRENHLVADPDDARPGIWLAHPHLSNAIYAAWHCGAAAEPVRRDHLREGVLSAIEYGNNPNQQQSPLWAISRALDSTLDDSTIADRLAGEELGPLLQDIQRTLLERYGGKLPLIQLPVWIEIKSLRPDIWLDPDPVEAGIAALLGAVTGEAGLRLTCQKLLQHLTRHSEEVCKRIEDATIHLLQRTTEWREWISILLDALRWCRRPEIGSIMVDWVDDHPSHVMVPVLLNLGIQHASGTEIQEKAVLELGLRYLEATPLDHGSWTYIWEALENAMPGDGQLRELGLRWLATVSPDRGSWAYVWQALDKGTPGDGQLRELGLRWLATVSPDRGSWAYVWEALDKGTPGDAHLRELGLHWLAIAPPDHGSWAYVWTALDKAIPGDAQLRELGLRWLATAPPDHGSWKFVWEALDKGAPGDAQLRELGLRWLAKAPPDHGSWEYLWKALREAMPGDALLGELGLRWLATAPTEHGSWTYVWEALVKAASGDMQLREFGLGWLGSAAPDHGSWAFVWMALNKATPGDAQLRGLGLRWLATVSLEHGSWAFVWEALDKATPMDTQLRELGLRWLATVSPDHRSWKFVWEALDKGAPGDAQLRELGLRWLASAPPDHRSWKFVWEELYKTTPGDAHLRELGLRWLATAPHTHGSWQYVWAALDKATPGDAQLRELALRWLNAAIQHKSWWYVWIELWNQTPLDEELSELGHRFLQETAENHFHWKEVESALAGHDSNSPILWIKRWEKNEDRARLIPIGRKLLHESIAHHLWASVFIRLWEAGERSEATQLLGAQWLAVNPNGRRADDIRKLLAIR